MEDLCECGNLATSKSLLCQECLNLLNLHREFTVGQQVRIIRRETRYGKICTVIERSDGNTNMYCLEKYGWRRCDEIEKVMSS